MKLESLMDFEWYNEPENVIFTTQEMKIVAKSETDFWQALHHKIKKDNAHFFFKKISGDFDLVVKWRFEDASRFNQCGLMVRLDERNWFKTSLMAKDASKPEIGTCLTIGGYSDWAGSVLDEMPQKIYYKLQRRGDDFVAFYSLDGEKYVRLRQFYLRGIEDEIKAGAYIAAPQKRPFEAVLDEIDFR